MVQKVCITHFLEGEQGIPLSEELIGFNPSRSLVAAWKTLGETNIFTCFTHKLHCLTSAQMHKPCRRKAASASLLAAQSCQFVMTCSGGSLCWSAVQRSRNITLSPGA